MQVTSDFKGGSSQTEFQGESTIPDNLSLMQRGFHNFGSQEGNSPGYGFEFPRSLEKTDVIKSPINFLGDHQRLTGQHSEISQPQPNQQQGSNDMEWKQHLIAKQMQEIQRQQQFHQLHLGARQLNTFNQRYGATGQAPGEEFPALLSGVPIANAAKYIPGELTGSELKSPGSFPMFIAGNMNWGPHNMPAMQGIPNGLIYSQDQGHSMHSVGYVPRQLDQSLHGIPVSGGMGSLNHYVQLQGMSHDSTSVDLLPKLGENHVERTPMQAFAFSHLHNDRRAVPNEVYSSASILTNRQGAQGKTLFGNALVQSTESGAVSGSIQQSNHLAENRQDGQEQTYWSGKSHESMSAHVAPSHGATSLDPTEEKILFGVDDDANWGAFLGESCNRAAGTYLNGYPLQNNDCHNVFPSLQSGTWSALVQEALEVSSSDTGHQEEWSGLNIQKSEQKVENHLVFLNEKNGKQNAKRDGDSNLQNTGSLTSKPFPLFCDANASQSFRSVPVSQQLMKLSYEQNDKLETDHSIQSVEQLSGATNDEQFDQVQQPYNFIENSPQERQWQQNASNGAWAVPTHQHAMQSTDSAEMGLNSQKMQHTWINQPKIPFYKTASQSSNKLSGQGIESPSASGSHIFKIDDNGDVNQYARSNDVSATMQMEMTYARSMGMVGESKDAMSLSSLGPDSDADNLKIPGEHSRASNLSNFLDPRSKLVINQQLQNRLSLDPVKHVSDHMFFKDKEFLVNHQKQPSMCPQDWDPPMCCTNKESGETHGHALSHLHSSSHNTDDVQKETHNSLLAGNDHFRLISSGQKLSDQFDRKPLGSRRFHFHPMGNLEMNMELANQEKDKSLCQGPHPTFWGLKNQEKEQFGNSQSIGLVASTNSTDMSKENLAIAEIQHTDTFPINNQAIQSFNATMPHNFSQDKRTALPSQNVPMLFRKEVESDEVSCARQQSISDGNAPCTHEGFTLDMPNSHWQHIKSNPQQGFSLNLAPPSQRHLAMGHSLAMQSLHRVNNFVPRNTESVSEAAQRAWSSSTTSAIALPTSRETSQRENFDNKPAISAQTSKEALYSKTKGSSLGMMTHIMNQSFVEQQQNVSHAPQRTQFDQPINHSFGSKVDVDGHVKHYLTPQAHESHDRSLIGQTSQALFHGMPGKAPATKHTSVIDNDAPTSSQIYSQDGGHSEMLMTSSNEKNSNEQRSDVKTLSANQPSAAPFVSQHGRYSTILNNLWRNASTQQPAGLHSQKFAPSLLESISSLQPTQHADDQSIKIRGNATSAVGMCSTNSQQCNYGEENPSKDSSSEQKLAMDMDASPRVVSASPVQEYDLKYFSDKSTVASISSFVRLQQQDIIKGKHADNQRERANLPTASTSINDTRKHNYSLLQQLQAMKGTDSDPSKAAGKRLQGIEGTADASNVDWAGGEKYICEQKTACRESVAASHYTDMKMLSFSSKDNEDRSTNASSHHLIVGDSAACRQATTSIQHELQSSYVNRSSIPTVTLGNECLTINPQMAPSWFEQYGTYKDSQTSTMPDSVGSFQRSTKATNQQSFFPKTSEIVDDDAIVKNRNDFIPENSSPSSVAADFHSFPHPKIKVADESFVQVRKKRKIATSNCLSWHRQVTQCSQSLQSFSMAEMDWAQATHRLIEKIEDDVENMDDVPSTTRSKRRLILTARLIQQLLPPAPAKFLFTDATASYEKVIYYTTKVILGEVCSLISSLESDSCMCIESGNMVLKKQNTSNTTEEFFLKIVESSIVRLRKLQSNFLRLDGGSSIVDIRMECQDVERGSIINRFAKFHGRCPADGVEGSSTSEAAPRWSLPQRNVTVVPMPRNLPDGVICLSL